MSFINSAFLVLVHTKCCSSICSFKLSGMEIWFCLLTDASYLFAVVSTDTSSMSITALLSGGPGDEL